MADAYYLHLGKTNRGYEIGMFNTRTSRYVPEARGIKLTQRIPNFKGLLARFTKIIASHPDMQLKDIIGIGNEAEYSCDSELTDDEQQALRMALSQRAQTVPATA